jgi:hypothetical protein
MPNDPNAPNTPNAGKEPAEIPVRIDGAMPCCNCRRPTMTVAEGIAREVFGIYYCHVCRVETGLDGKRIPEPGERPEKARSAG